MNEPEDQCACMHPWSEHNLERGNSLKELRMPRCNMCLNTTTKHFIKKEKPAKPTPSQLI